MLTFAPFLIIFRKFCGLRLVVNIVTMQFQDWQGSKHVIVKSVAIATGHHCNPNIPKIPGEETYNGMS